MAFFIDFEKRTRHRYIDASIENTFLQLAQPGVAGRLGEKLVHIYKERASLLKVVDVRHGELKHPKKLDDEHVPVVTLRDGETIKVDPRSMLQTPLQSRETQLRFNS